MTKKKEQTRDVTFDSIPPEVLEYLKKTQQQEAVKDLFEIEDDDDLIKKTETPDSMMLPMVMNEVVEEAMNPLRTDTLATVFRKRFDRRMISRKRMGRKEVLIAHSTSVRQDDGEEELSI